MYIEAANRAERVRCGFSSEFDRSPFRSPRSLSFAVVLSEDIAMPRLSSIHRIVLGLVSLTVSILLLTSLFGLIPNTLPLEYQSRKSFCESTAVSFMALASRMDQEQLQQTIDNIRLRNPDVLSIGIRRGDGDLALESGTHDSLWSSSDRDDMNQTVVPILSSGEVWGQLEVQWTESTTPSILGFRPRPEIVLTALVGLMSFVVFSFYLRKVLQHLSPSKVVPTRVRDALNALAEGLLVLDKNQNIVLANESIAEATELDSENLVGRQPTIFGFRFPAGSATGEFPWTITAKYSQPIKGILLARGEGVNERTFSVSTVPVIDAKNVNRGVVASFEDVTQLQKKQEELRGALSSLKTSTEEVRKQNRELEWLATRDTLTGCLNRRSFFRDYETQWSAAIDNGRSIAAAMVDIDHFKSINDNHGHSMGDEVLRVVSRTVMETVADSGIVCRYGGEEFTVLFPESTIDEAEILAEQCRLAIQSLKFKKLKVTASLGVSALCQRPENPQDMLDQADKCLYVAKRNGRNQVVRWDRAQDQVAKLADEQAPTREEEAKQASANAASDIPFHAVAALTSALAHRDQETAIHSRRVADMCVATAEGLLSLRECYVLELAALLHDIGKIGIPDALLKKQGALSKEEIEVVHSYNRMGVEMVRGSFSAPTLTEIVEQHVVHYDMSNASRGAGPGRQPSISARILSIANAYDTMVSKLSYRDKITKTAAFAELRRCAGSQFDPELVERFIGAVQLRHHHHSESESAITKESALSIGLLLEKLVVALDSQDGERLNDIAESIQIAATTHGLSDIAKLARQLCELLSEDHDEIEVMQVAGELLDLCRSTQSTLIDSELTSA